MKALWQVQTFSVLEVANNDKHELYIELTEKTKASTKNNIADYNSTKLSIK